MESNLVKLLHSDSDLDDKTFSPQSKKIKKNNQKSMIDIYDIDGPDLDFFGDYEEETDSQEEHPEIAEETQSTAKVSVDDLELVDSRYNVITENLEVEHKAENSDISTEVINMNEDMEDNNNISDSIETTTDNTTENINKEDSPDLGSISSFSSGALKQYSNSPSEIFEKLISIYNKRNS